MDEKKEQREKCFVIMPFTDPDGYTKGHFQKIYEQIFIPAIDMAGFKEERVDENKISDSILNRIFNGVQNAPIALCDLSGRNPNVLYELGLRHAYDKPVVLVQDEKTEKIFDVGGINTIPYSSSRLYEDVIIARERISDALNATYKNKNSSIVKIAKAQMAVVDESEITKEDKIDIALNSILGEISSLKMQRDETLAVTEILNFAEEDEYRKLKEDIYRFREYLTKIDSGSFDLNELKSFEKELELFNIKLSKSTLTNRKRVELRRLVGECKDYIVRLI